MPENAHVTMVNADNERLREVAPSIHDPRALHEKAEETARSLTWLPNSTKSRTFSDRTALLVRAFKPILRALELPPPAPPVSDDFRWLYDNGRLIYADLFGVAKVLKPQSKMPHVRTSNGEVLPRPLAVVEAFLEATSYQFDEQEFVLFVEVFQKTTVLQLRELWALVPLLELVLLEKIAANARTVLQNPHDDSQHAAVYVRSLRDIGQIPWKDTLEPLIVFDEVLRQDPAGAYPEMDRDSRDLYRTKISKIADHSDCGELEVAQEALAMAREANQRHFSNPRVALRESHIGYYLLDKGSEALYQKVRYRPPFLQKVQITLRRHPDEFFLLGIEMLALAIMATALSFLTDPFTSAAVIAFSILVLLLPSSQSAVQVINHLITAVLTPDILPKLDYSNGVPGDCITLVSVPSLLLNEKQIQGLVEDLEVRFLGNHDPNIHFALLTDLADSREPSREDSPLIDLCAELVQALNEKYASQGMGSFFMLHRHRIYNPRERLWMGWERKRGKLLDLNKFLRGQYDSFPVKTGDLSILPQVRFVITLDSDTELPRGAARRMIGALAHPLNQAVIDPERNVVTSGYGILQPRVGVSVQSTTRSRLAAIYAGETGFDIYTRAVSDAYQDLYGEGSFTGKGIYEVDTIHQVLDRRFPRNALLSHDLIEGAYARAGLASDIEVIEDYPSHYSAYNRRKHRWLRGDWQVAGWLLPTVPEESHDQVPNPISLISWWKIFDNLRRSLVEPALFTLFVAGWFMPDTMPARWTLSAIGILLVPMCFRLLLDLGRAAAKWDWTVAQDAFSGLYTSAVNLLFMLLFLAHQTLISVDAVIRALVRRFVTQRRLLEWETAAEAELNTRGRAPVDTYLNWTPVLAVGLALLILTIRPGALFVAAPILVLWASTTLVSSWLNSPPFQARSRVSGRDVRFLRGAALRTWRYFAEFSTQEHNWLVPDNVQEQPPAVAARVSPTNVGLLLNARQVACEFGYLTVPEFADRTVKTLTTIKSLQKYRGHLLNWYDTRDLKPLAPMFVSSVDSGNLLASLWTLQHGSLDRLRQPILQPALAEGFLDLLRTLNQLHALPRKLVAHCEREQTTDQWLQCLLAFPDEVLVKGRESLDRSKRGAQTRWFAVEASRRLQSIRQTVNDYAPWLAMEFASLRTDSSLNPALLDSVALEQLPEFIDQLAHRVNRAMHSEQQVPNVLYRRFYEALRSARVRVMNLIADLHTVADDSGKLADEMDFKFLLNKHRKLLSIGFDVDHNRLHSACYDLLATESRTAVFVAIAKEDILQESWFLLDRSHTLDRNRPVLLSWTGTLFEYLMPALWMRSYSNTLLERSRAAAVRSQQSYAARKGVPWGISESAYSKLDENGNYQYYAFGLPGLALRKPEIDGLVISPYATFLALDVDPMASLRNLHTMDEMGWFGDYGFYESADFSAAQRRFWRDRYQLVRCWMAHHQGMSLLALANFLRDNVVQSWFHAERRVQATELLLHEKPVAHVRREDVRRLMAA